MPKLHFPVRGGTQIPKGNHGPAQNGNAGDCANCRELAAEVARLRQQAGQSQRAGALGGSGSTIPMVWAALGVCGVGLLFALLALLHHG